MQPTGRLAAIVRLPVLLQLAMLRAVLLAVLLAMRLVVLLTSSLHRERCSSHAFVLIVQLMRRALRRSKRERTAWPSSISEPGLLL